jgi:uncharacterized protein
VSLYLDASVLVALFVIDPTSARAETYLVAHPDHLVVSDFGAAEFSSAVARRVRTRELTSDDGRLAFADLDSWLARSADRQQTTTTDIDAADRICGGLQSTFARRMHCTSQSPNALTRRWSPSISGWPQAPARSAWRLRRPDGCRRRAEAAL